MFVVTTFVDSDWAGFTTTRNSKTGRTIIVRSVPAHHCSRTQSTVSLSSGDAELYGLGSSLAETMGVLLFLWECNAKTNGYATRCTDSTAGKSETGT